MAKESVLANHETIRKALVNDHGLKVTAAARLITKYRDTVNSGIELMSGAWFVANQLLEKEYGDNEPPRDDDMDPNWKGPVDEDEEEEEWSEDDDEDDDEFDSGERPGDFDCGDDDDMDLDDDDNSDIETDADED